jgi:putative peptidoglycan lipid II flippase
MNKSEEHHSKHKIARSAGVIAMATLVSRILGFIRDMVIARLFGVYVYAQAFVIAFKLPNLFRDLVGEGATNSAIVPVFSEYLAKEKKAEFWELCNILMNLLLVILAGITVFGIVFSPVLVRLIAPGFANDPAQLAVTVKLNRLIFPYILLIGLAAYSMGILNSLRHFTIPAFAPCLLNISIIVCALIWGEGIKGLASGVLIGGVGQLAIQLPILYKKGFRFSFTNKFRHPAITKIGKLMTPRLFSSAIYQLNNFVDTIFGSLSFIVGNGAVAALYFSYRLIQFPLGIFGNSLSQAILPTLSLQAVDPQDHGKFRETLAFGMRSILFVMVPASIGFMVLAKPIVSALFMGGKFDSYSVEATAGALFFYSIGLFAYGSTKILQNAFFALKDTFTPTVVSAVILLLNICLNAILMYPMRLSGLALATSISGIIGFFVLFYLINKKVKGIELKSLVLFFFKVTLASCGMALVCWWAARITSALSVHIAGRIFNLALPVICGIISYIGFSLLLGIDQARSLLRLHKLSDEAR